MFAAVTILSSLLQKPVTFSQGQGWDGQRYYEMAERLAAGELPRTTAPYIYRIGTPALAALAAPHRLLAGFRWVNAAGALCATVLLLLWLRRYIAPSWVRLVVCAMFVTQWHSPPRFVHYYPAISDAWASVGMLALLIGYARLKERCTAAGILLLCAGAAAGVLFRETVLLVPVAAAAALIHFDVPIGKPSVRRLPALACILPAACGIAALVAVRKFVTVVPGTYGIAAQIHDAWVQKPVLGYVQSCFTAFGPVLALVMYNWRRSWRFLASHLDLFAFLLGMMLLAGIGGMDTERLVYAAFPVIYLLIALALANLSALLKSPLIIVPLLTAQVIAQRLFWTLPDYPNHAPTKFPVFTIPSSHFPYLDLYAAWGMRDVQTAMMVEYLLFTALLFCGLYYREWQRGEVQLERGDFCGKDLSLSEP